LVGFCSGVLIDWRFLVAGKGDIGRRFEKLLPELREVKLVGVRLGIGVGTLEPSQTFFECSAYCSTTGRMLVVTMRWARLKL